MDLSIYFEPIELPDSAQDEDLDIRLGSLIRKHTLADGFPELTDVDIAIIGVLEDRNSVNNKGCSQAPDPVREQLYQLFKGDFKPRIVDLGNIKQGHRIEDTYFALTSVVTDLVQNKTIPLIIGGGQDLTFANYRAYEALGQVINILSLDPSFDLGKNGQELNSQTYLNKIILHQPNFLFNYTNMGYQSYYVNPEAISTMNSLYFDVYRLGKIRENMEEAEPLTRNADMLTVDMAVVRQSDAPGNALANPNGFFGEEICQIMRYAGFSDKLSSLGIYEYNPTKDRDGQTAKLIAQMIWYFLEGYYNRMHDNPYKDKNNFVKYTVSIKDHKDELIFYKSKKSDRWWMDVPVQKNLKNIFERHHLVPCSYADYEIALQDDIPDRWWKAYQKLM